MTTERILTEYTADTSNFRRGARVYEQTLARQHRLTNDRLNRIDRRWERSTRSILATRTALSGLTGVVGGTALNQLRQYAEGWKDVERRLTSIGASSEEAQKGLVSLALRTRSSIGGTAAAVQRLVKSTGDGIDVSTRRVETLQKLLASAGADGSERASVSLQLGQALQSGVLSGDEFRSIRENAPVEFLDALAKAAGITRQELKGFAEQQKLTSKIVLQALDDLAGAADEKFGALAVSGEEAFNVLATGLTAYAGNVDKALGATETINGALVWLGEYLSDAGAGAETMAQAVRLVGTVALVTAGSRGLGALNAAFQRSAATARVAAAEAQKEVASSRARVAAAQQQIAATRALVAQREAEVSRRLAANKKLTTAVRQLEAAKRKEARATVALAGAEARARVATDGLTTAQARLSFAARAAGTALKTMRGVLAFFGGPVGLAISALAALPLLVKDTDDRLGEMQTATSQAEAALDQYAQASARAAKEQKELGGSIGSATVAILSQSRAKMQDSLNELRPAFEKTLSDIARSSSGLIPDIVSEFRKANGGFGPAEGFDPSNPIARISELNPALGEVVEKIREIAQGGTDLAGLADVLDRIRGTGEAAAEAFQRYSTALAEGIDQKEAEAGLIAFAEATGQFEEQLIALQQASNSADYGRAFIALSTAILDVSRAAEVMDAESLKALANMATEGSKSAKIIAILEARLAGNTEEAERLYAELQGVSGQMDTIGSTNISGPITTAANEAARLAQNLAAARAQEFNKLTGGNPDFFDPRNESGNAGRIFRHRPVPVQNRPGYKPPKVRKSRSGGGGGGSGASAAAEAERDLSTARELLLENGQKALFIEQKLNAEREKLQELMPSLIELGLSRAEAEGVIHSELERTEEKLQKVKTASEEAAASFAKSILEDIRAADDLNDALGRISERLLDLAFDRAFDLLADQFARLGTASKKTGGGGGGGFFANILGDLLGFAHGGLVRGPGTATSDSVPAMLSDGEYVVRAKSVTPRTLPLLQAINAGPTIPRFANGGLVGARSVPAAAGATMSVEVHNHASNAQVHAQPSADGKSLKLMIWDAVSEGIIGGRFDKPNGVAFGLRRAARGG